MLIRAVLMLWFHFRDDADVSVLNTLAHTNINSILARFGQLQCEPQSPIWRGRGAAAEWTDIYWSIYIKDCCWVIFRYSLFGWCPISILDCIRTLSTSYLIVVFIYFICAAQDSLAAVVLKMEDHLFSHPTLKSRWGSRDGRACRRVSREIISSLSCHAAAVSVHLVLSKHLGLFSGWCPQIWPLVLLLRSQERNARSARDGETEEWMTSYPITCHLYTGPASGLEETTWDKQLHGKRFWSPPR